jgi:hypothetical protein
MNTFVTNISFKTSIVAYFYDFVTPGTQRKLEVYTELKSNDYGILMYKYTESLGSYSSFASFMG